MKKFFIMFLTSILFILNINSSISVFAATDNTIYIPKIVRTSSGNKLVYVPELAEIARKMSSDAYGIEKGATTSIAKTMEKEDFEDIQIRRNASKTSGDLAENFLVGVKNFKVDGKEKHILAIAFRGTDIGAGGMDALNDIITDALYVDLNGFHSGFCGSASNAFNILYDGISFKSIKDSNGKAITFSKYLELAKDGKEGYYILVTGHSLGGAIANIFTGDILAGFGVRSNAMCYTFGTPTVCSSSKAKSLDAYNVFNIINTKDPVPKIGYNIGEGVRLGKDLKETVSAGILFDNHTIGSAYKTTTALVRNNIEMLYKYTLDYYDEWSEENTAGSNGGGFRGDNDGNGSGSNNPSVNPAPTPAPVQKPSTPPSISLSKSSINLDMPSKRTDTVEITLSGTLPSRYRLDFDCSSSVQISWGGWTNNSKKNSLTITATENTQNGSTATIFLRDDDGNTYATATIPVRVTTSWTSMTLKAPSSIGIDYVKNPTQKVTVEIDGTMPNSSLQTICNNSISAEMKNWNGKTVDVYITANYKIKDIDGSVELQLLDKNNNVMDSAKIAVYNTTPLYSVSYNLNGGYYPSQYDSDYLKKKTYREYQGEDFFVDLDAPSRDGYMFLGWSMNPNARKADYRRGNSYYHDGKSDVVLYAVWEKLENLFDLELERHSVHDDTFEVAEYFIDGDRFWIDDIVFHCDKNIECNWGMVANEDGSHSIILQIDRNGDIASNKLSFDVIDEDGYILFSDTLSVFENYNKKQQFSDRNQTGISVYVNGKKLEFDVQPQIINNRTMVPMRKIFEELGTIVGWNNNTQNVIAVRKGDVIRIGIGGLYMTCNDERKMLDSPAVIISGRTLVPVRAIAESLNCDVEWYDYGTSQVVDINMNDTVESMENKGGLLIGWCEYAPFSYIDEDGNLTGFDTDLAKYVCDFWGWDVSFVEIPFDMSLTSVMRGEIDCYWNGVTKTEERAEMCTFTNPYIEFDLDYDDGVEKYTSHEVYSVPFGKDDYDTVELVNIALDEAQKDGTIAHLKWKYGIQ